jgi:hypothetical protein
MGMTQCFAGPNRVVVPSANPLVAQVAGSLEVGDDSLGGALGEAGNGGDFADADARVVRDDDENPGMAREERPWSVVVIDYGSSLFGTEVVRCRRDDLSDDPNLCGVALTAPAHPARRSTHTIMSQA